jgi:hypothetical protein
VQAVNAKTLWATNPAPVDWDPPAYSTCQVGDMTMLQPQGLVAGFQIPLVVSLGT